jgi:hypothetical protein
MLLIILILLILAAISTFSIGTIVVIVLVPLVLIMVGIRIPILHILLVLITIIWLLNLRFVRSLVIFLRWICLPGGACLVIVSGLEYLGCLCWCEWFTLNRLLSGDDSGDSGHKWMHVCIKKRIRSCVWSNKTSHHVFYNVLTFQTFVSTSKFLSPFWICFMVSYNTTIKSFLILIEIFIASCFIFNSMNFYLASFFGNMLICTDFFLNLVFKSFSLINRISSKLVFINSGRVHVVMICRFFFTLILIKFQNLKRI